MNSLYVHYFTIILIVFIVALIGSIVSSSNIKNWYYTNQVIRSPYSPNGYVFGIVWTIIYILYAWTWCIAYKKSEDRYFYIFSLSIVLNLAWTIAFFGLHNLLLSRIIILILLAVVVYQIKIMKDLDSELGAFFMSIYALWLIFATILNFTTTISF